MRSAELCGAFRHAVGHEDETKMVCQGADDREFVRALSSSAIESPRRTDIAVDHDQNRREIYQIISKGQDLEFNLIAVMTDARLSVCQNEFAYILRDNRQIFVCFG
jgi:hypothetical protein